MKKEEKEKEEEKEEAEEKVMCVSVTFVEGIEWLPVVVEGCVRKM
jgi:hypothetical protein